MAEKVRNLIEKNRIVRRLIALVLSFCLLLAIVIVYLRNSLGWFANNKDVSGNGAQVKIAADIFPEMKAWRFDLEAQSNDDEVADTLNKAGTWVDAINNKTTTNPKAIKHVEEKNTGGSGEKYKFVSLHLGTIDNLLETSNDNCFYIRFDVTDKIYRSAIGFSLEKADIHVYDMDGVERTDTIDEMEDSEGNNLNILDKFVAIFQVDAAIDSNEYAPTDKQKEIDELFTEENRLENDGDSLRDFGAQANQYYIYIRFSPDLEKCFEATDHIATYMPCEVTFDVTLTLTFD